MCGGGRGGRGVVPPKEGGCLTGVFEFMESSGKADGKVALDLDLGVSGGPNSHLLRFHRKNWSVYHC